MLLALLFLLTAVVSFLVGALLDSKYHDKFAAQYRTDKQALIDEYDTLLTKAHAERDALFAKYHATPPLAAIPPAPDANLNSATPPPPAVS